MSVSVRSLLVPGTALATAGVVALGPALMATPAAVLAHPVAEVPAMHVAEIQLAGVGRDIYDSITQFVQYTVSSAQYWISLLPVIGPPIADQVGINYFVLIQPVIANTVYFLSDVIADPLNFIALSAAYGSNLFYAGYNWVSAQLSFFGLPGLLPIPVPPPLAAVPAPTRGGADTPGAAAAVAAATGEEAPAAPAASAASKAGAVRAARPAQPEAGADAPRSAARVARSAAAADEGAAAAGADRPAGKAGATRGGAATR